MEITLVHVIFLVSYFLSQLLPRVLSGFDFGQRSFSVSGLELCTGRKFPARPGPTRLQPGPARPVNAL